MVLSRVSWQKYHTHWSLLYLLNRTANKTLRQCPSVAEQSCFDTSRPQMVQER